MTNEYMRRALMDGKGAREINRQEFIQYFLRKKRRNQGPVSGHPHQVRNPASLGGMFVGKTPGQNNGCFDDEITHVRPSSTNSLIARSPSEK